MYVRQEGNMSRHPHSFAPRAADIKSSVFSYSQTEQNKFMAQCHKEFKCILIKRKKKKERKKQGNTWHLREKKVLSFLSDDTDWLRFVLKLLKSTENGKYKTKVDETHTEGGSRKKPGKTVTNSTVCIYNARGLHRIQLITISLCFTS